MGRIGRAVTLLAGCCLTVAGCGLVGGPQAQLQHTAEITVTSPMVSQGTMSARYTCYGSGKTPPLFWSGMPSGTRSVALVVDDSSAPITPRVYWIVFDISPDTTDIQAGSLPTGALQARNSTGKASYDPPCPSGGPHRYRFTVYALNAVLHQQDGTRLKAAWSAIAQHAIAHGRLTATALP